MRKRISCKVIRSAPLDKSDNIALRADIPQAEYADTAALSYTNRLQITRIDVDPTAQNLDCHA
jgi:hypothetical protein